LLYAVNSEPTKPALNGACFNFLEDTVDFVATDGHRLVKISKQNTTSILGSFIIPKKFLSILGSFLEGQSETNLVISGDLYFSLIIIKMFFIQKLLMKNILIIMR
jgi:DNA polymerase-3 subunit beta